MCYRVLFSLGLGLLVCLPSSDAVAHDSPEHVIEDLTREMARRGPSAELLYRRACEYRALGDFGRAAGDLRAALELKRGFFSAQVELGRVELARGQADEARRAAERAEPLAATPRDKAVVQMLHCEILRGRDPERALAHCQRACRLHPGEVEWLLVRSRIQGDLGRHEQRIRDLVAARRINPSFVLEIELVEAQIDGAEPAAALERIEAELADSRWRSSWLLRRARVRQKLGHADAARADLQAAIAEIDQRLNPARPDVSLLADRGLAQALLGNLDAARADLAAARARYADAWTLHRLEALLPAISTNPDN